jgi:hypothetical protein
MSRPGLFGTLSCPKGDCRLSCSYRAPAGKTRDVCPP